MARTEADARTEEEVARLVEAVHGLLDGPDGMGQFDYSSEKERIVLDIPKAWVVLAAWLAIKERKRRAGRYDAPAFMRPDQPGHVDKQVRSWARGWLWGVIHEQMHAELHELAVGLHRFLSPPPDRKQEDDRAPDLDDGIPF